MRWRRWRSLKSRWEEEEEEEDEDDDEEEKSVGGDLIYDWSKIFSLQNSTNII